MNSQTVPDVTRPPRRGGRPQMTLEVVRREQLSPHLVRLTFGGAAFDSFVPKFATDQYVKVYFAKPELGLSRPYDIEALRETLAPADLPVTRTYTVRAYDLEAKTLSIEFVVHGDEGIAGPWAASAQLGDLITFSGPGGNYAPEPTAGSYLFAGDQSALPAIAAALAALPPDAVGQAFLEVGDSADVFEVDAPAGVTLTWLFSGGTEPGTSTALRDAIAAWAWPQSRPHIFAHGERGAMKALRDLFRERGVTRDELSLSGYWAAGRAEDRFQAEKREPIGQIAPVSD